MNSASDVWAAVISGLEKKLTPTAMATWFDGTRAVDLKDNIMVVCAASEFKRNIIQSRYADMIKEILAEIFSGECELVVLTEADLEEYQLPDTQSPLDSSQFTFEHFVVGPANRFAQAAAMAVANQPGKAYNPLLIYGDSGLGKTHLLYAIGHEVRSRDRDLRIVYIKGDEFTNELIAAIQNATQEAFREKYRTADLLLVDDVQFIAGKVQTQEEFFHTFNTLFEAGKQIVLTSDRPPREMLRLEDRLKTRFEWGLMADIQPPDYETRVAIAKNKADQLGLALPSGIPEYLAENLTANVRQIEGAVKKIQAYRDLLYGEIDIDMIKKILADVIRGEREYTPELIIERVAAFYDLPVESVTGQSRVAKIAHARMVSMYLMRKLMDLTLDVIGSYFGNKDHATVLHAIKKIEVAVATDPEEADVLRDITSNITNKE
ncbi:MAG: chromosomal replication initiator protein DnaA [Oscillospiraceae bacterium]|nr:chromosomal replication initiator protein DnaA [Oscillospiraceae bacterium]